MSDQRPKCETMSHNMEVPMDAPSLPLEMLLMMVLEDKETGFRLDLALRRLEEYGEMAKQ